MDEVDAREPRVTVSSRVSRELARALEEIAVAEDRSRSHVIERVIREHVTEGFSTKGVSLAMASPLLSTDAGAASGAAPAPASGDEAA